MNAYQESQIPKLVSALFRGAEVPEQGPSSSILALAAAQSSEGVSTIAFLIAREAARNSQARVLLVSTAELKTLTRTDLEQPETRWAKRPIYNLWQMVPHADSAPSAEWDSDPQFVRDVFNALRRQFDVVLVDSAPLLTSHDFSVFGHLTDGAIVVVQADHSNKEQLKRALQVLATTGSAFKGFVLNRQKYPIPDRIYRWLRS